jgi:hypothetical protein
MYIHIPSRDPSLRRPWQNRPSIVSFLSVSEESRWKVKQKIRGDLLEDDTRG